MGNALRKGTSYEKKGAGGGKGGQCAAPSPTEKPRHAGSILGLSLVNNQLISCSDDKTIGISAWTSGGGGGGDGGDQGCLSAATAPVRYCSGHKKAVNRVVGFENDEGVQVCWSSSRDLSIKYWNITTGQLLRSIEDTHTLTVAGVAVGRNKQLVYSGSRDYSVKGWDIETGKCVIEFTAPRNIVTVMEFEASGESLLFQGSEDLCVRAWDTKSGARQPAIHITGYVYFPVSMTLHGNGYHLATGSKGFNSVGCEVKLWDLRKFSSPCAEMKGHSHDVTGVKFATMPSLSDAASSSSLSTPPASSSPSTLVSVSKDGSIFAWDTSNPHAPAALSSTPAVSSRQFTSVALLESSTTDISIAAAAFDGSLSFFRLRPHPTTLASLHLVTSTAPFSMPSDYNSTLEER